MSSPQATYRAIVCVDMERFSDRRDPHQMDMRRGLYEALECAFEASGVPAAYHEDRGDGGFFLVPADGPQARLVEPLPFELAAELGRYNRTADEHSRIRLRIALHAGYVQHDEEGVVSNELNLAFRLLDSTPLRERLRTADGDLAFMCSEEFHRTVIRQRRDYSVSDYSQVHVEVKRTVCEAWLCPCAPQTLAGREYGEKIGPLEASLVAIEETLGTASRERARTVRVISSPVPEVPDVAAGLRERLEALDETRRKRLWDQLPGEVAEAEGVAAVATEKARTALRAIREPMWYRDELRGRLKAYQAMAHNHQRAEDENLHELYERARELLATVPCDLGQAEEAAERYRHAIHGVVR